MTELFTVRDAAARLRVSEKTVRRLIAGGVLPCARIGAQLRIRPDDLEQYVAAQVTAAPAGGQAGPAANRMRTGGPRAVSNGGGWRPPDAAADQHVRGRRVS